MAFHPAHVKNLIEDFALFVGESVDKRGYHVMSDYMEDHSDVPVSNFYLSDIYRRVCGQLNDGETSVKAQQNKMDAIAKVLGYENFLKYAKAISEPVSPLLIGCIGNWWSLVRANNGAYILKAPVRISLTDQRTIAIELKGGRKQFTGTVSLRSGNIFCELDTGEDKKLFIVMKVGTRSHPRLLQGTFAGISTGGDPIAGRELFLREEEIPFEEMYWNKLGLSLNNLDERINNYFSTYHNNCIKINNVSTFSMTDLDPITDKI